MGKVDEIEEEEYNSIVEEKRHNELLEALKEIGKKNFVEKDDTKVLQLIASNHKDFTDALKSLKKEEKSDTFVKDIEKLVARIEKSNLELLEELKKKPKRLEINRESIGSRFIKSIDINY